MQVKKLQANHAHLINRNNFRVLIFQVSATPMQVGQRSCRPSASSELQVSPGNHVQDFLFHVVAF